MRIRSFILPILMIILGAVLLLLGVIMKQGIWVMLGAFLTMITGGIAVLLKVGVLQRRMGFVIGATCTIVAALLAFRNYHDVSTHRNASSGPDANTTTSTENAH